MTTATKPPVSNGNRATPIVNQKAHEIQAFGHVVAMPLALSEKVRKQSVDNLNQLLFDKHYGEQADIVDTIAERIMTLGGLSVAMAHDVAETTTIPRPPKGREEAPVQLSRLCQAHEIILQLCHTIAKQAADAGDDGTNDMVVGGVMRPNEMQAWFLAEHLVNMPLAVADAGG